MAFYRDRFTFFLFVQVKISPLICPVYAPAKHTFGSFFAIGECVVNNPLHGTFFVIKFYQLWLIIAVYK
jgi:hypothetical protein